ncbi:response regulator transcription factor [Azorhizobium oxalatiphilum]|nr:response regulator [Azorhizobium oxalatiphilum]
MIVIIDDDESVRTATQSLVRSLGFGASCFESAEAFLGSPLLGAADCVISDVQMPGMSGIDLTRHLNARGHATPVILITAFPEDRIRRQADAAGAFGFFAKPFDGHTMIECIDRALSTGGAQAN